MNTNHQPTRRQWLQAAGAVALGPGAMLAGPVRAQANFPDKPIRIIVPLPPGGSADAAARMFGEQLAQRVRQPVIVENKPGGLYLPALQALAAAPADGYTLLHVNVSMCSIQAAMRKFDLLKQVVPITKAGETTAVLVASAKSGIKSVKELVERAKAQPGRLNYAVGGLGSAEHLITVMLEKSAGFDAIAVPFKGAVDGSMALMQGEVDFQILPTPLVLALLPKGSMTPLASLSAARVSQLAQVPTLAEAGIGLTPFAYWAGFAAPVGTPAAVIDFLRQHINQAVLAPELQPKLASIGLAPAVSGTPAEFTQLIQGDVDRMSAAVKAGKLKFD